VKRIKLTHSGVIYKKVRGLPKTFCNTFSTSVKINTKCLQFFLWLISNVPLAITALQSVRGVPGSQNDYHKTVRKEMCPDLLPVTRLIQKVSCHGLCITGDETLIHHFEAQTKRQSTECHHPTFPQKKKFKATP
jgi:hypothetical protein